MMRRVCLAILGAAVLALPALAQEPAAQPAAPEAAPDRSGVEEIIVTAQKREESINDVGMSIQAATGDELAELGITDTSQLDRVVTGFNANVTYYGTAIYTIRGVGFQDTSLASGPTVSVYIDEMPLPFSAMTTGATLDLQRVEALKGPQGTLFGQNATGGAVNYIANKPSQELEAGFDVSIGRFETVDVSGFLGGPITETLSYRLAARMLMSGDWQKSYTADNPTPPDPNWVAAGRSYDRNDEHGESKLINMRGALLFEPTDRLSALFTVSGFLDRGESQMPQLFGIATLNQVSGANPLVANFPTAPHNNRAADWGPCVNTSGGFPTDVTDPNPIPDYGLGDTNDANRLYDRCTPAERDNTYYSTTLRVDFDITDEITLTSLTSWGKFDREAALESDGTLYQDYESYQKGYLKAAFQEIRLSGSIFGEGNWVLGGNYQNLSTWDSFMQTYGISTAVPTFVPRVFSDCGTTAPPGGIAPYFLIPGSPHCFGLDPATGFTGLVFTSHPLGPTNPNNRQKTDAWAIFGNAEYPVFEWLTGPGGSLAPHGTALDYKTGSIQRVDLRSGAVATVYEACDGRALRGPNDLVFDASGGFWFSDLGKGDGDRMHLGHVLYARPDGSRITRVREGMLTPNGVGLSPDGRTLYVAETHTSRVWVLPVSSPGVLAPEQGLFSAGSVLGPLPGYQLLDSLAVEASGRVCVATLVNGGITAFDPAGGFEHFPVPDPLTTNICFGGADMRDAWITASSTGKLYKCRWPRPGLRLAFNA